MWPCECALIGILPGPCCMAHAMACACEARAWQHPIPVVHRLLHRQCHYLVS